MRTPLFSPSTQFAQVPRGTAPLHFNAQERMFALHCEWQPHQLSTLWERFQKLFGALERHELLAYAMYARRQNFLLLSQLFLIQAACGYRFFAHEAKGSVRDVLPIILSNPPLVCAFYRRWQQLQMGRALPNALKKGIAQVLSESAQHPETLLAADLSVLGELIRLVHPRPKTQRASQLFADILQHSKMSRLQVFEQAQQQILQPAHLRTWLQQVDLREMAQRYQVLSLHRLLEEPPLQALCQQALHQSQLRPSLREGSGELTIALELGAGMLQRLAHAPWLQVLDAAAFVATLLAQGWGLRHLTAVGTELKRLKLKADVVHNALALRQLDCGWGAQAWRCIRQIQTPIALYLASGPPDLQVLGAWQRVLQSEKGRRLIWVNVNGPASPPRWEPQQQMLYIQAPVDSIVPQLAFESWRLSLTEP